MDHAARHLSSSSPTSSFLFHHSEKSFKSSDLLAPLLSSETEDSDVHACFSATAITESAIIENFSPNQSDEDSNIRYHRQDIGEQQNLDTKEDHLGGQQLILGHFCGSGGSIENNREANLDLRHHRIGCANHMNENEERDDEADEDEDDEDENMRNMLSGSSRSSATTMPLLTDAHTHHSFSERISLEEYSPLSLVNDCDNALPMSPTSLACGSHHSSFKSSLNNLKIDHLGVEGVVDVGAVHGVDDVVGDTRSMSPSLLSNANSHHQHHHNMWSNSSTAITQNPSLLTSTSTSILLSQHSHHPTQHPHHSHHHSQMNTLMQHLEPQSLDEPPPLIGNNGSGLDSDLNSGQNAQILLHRPSSEPPLNSGIGVTTNVESRNMADMTSTSSTKMTESSGHRAHRNQSSSSASASTSTHVTSNGANSSNKLKGGLSLSSSTSSRSSTQTKNNRSKQRTRKNESVTNTKMIAAESSSAVEKSHSSKLHLLLNHHKKLKELQQRLFGNTSSTTDSNKQEIDHSNDSAEDRSCLDRKLSTGVGSTRVQPSESCFQSVREAKEEADSSASKEPVASTVDTKQQQQGDSPTNQSNSMTTKAVRQNTRRRRPPPKNQASKIRDALSEQTSSKAATTRSTHKIVKTETAEPDTTTKSSECLKLADLLTSNNTVEQARGNNDSNVIYNPDSANGVNNDDGDNNCERKFQHTQLQMNPSPTVVASNNGLVQSNNLQQQQPQLSNSDNKAISIGSSNDTAPQYQTTNATIASLVGIETSGGSAGPLIKCNIVSSGDVGSGGETGASDSLKRGASDEPNLLLNWPITINSNGNNQCNTKRCESAANTSANTVPTTTIGAHQIAIQVICQDGTSLVLPVSTATSLNTAVTLSAQNQAQIQAILTNSGNTTMVSNCQQHRSNNAQMIPIVAMINNRASNAAPNYCAIGSQKNTGSSGSTTSGLAASSPTLAALLDAGSYRGSALSASSPEMQGQNLISGNLLRKFITATPVTQNQFATGDSGNSSNATTMVCSTSNGMKRIKLEANSDAGSNNNSGMQNTTFTIIDPQSLIVTNGNENEISVVSDNSSSNNNCSDMTSGAESSGEQVVTKSAQSSSNQSPGFNNAASMQLQQQQQLSTDTNSINNGNSKNKVVHECTMNKQLSKMNSSTGNRQVDPAQPFRCEHCNSTFTRLGNFTRHKKIHTVPTKDGQRFKCDVCSKSFLQRCDLARHLHIHRGTEPHRCNICGKGYIRHSDLVTHQRFHNKEKPFGCPHCSKGFCQRGDLNRHLRSIHLQMKPILCPCCNRKFAKQETLLRHLNTAHRGSNKSIVAGTSNGQTVVGESTAGYQMPLQSGTKKHNRPESIITVSLVATGSANSDTSANGNVNSSDTNSGSNDHKIAASVPVASLQAIQATLCKVQQSVDPSKKVKVAGSAPDGPTSIARAIS